jgi:glutathione S-transferase
MIKLYGHPMSTCTRKVLTTLHETDTAFEMNVVDFATGEHKKEPHTTRQPFGQLPALDDDGFGMFESRAMARYVDGKAGNKLTPTEPHHRAKMEQWISVETEDFTPNAMKFVYHSVFKREQTPEVLKTAGEKLETAVRVMDANLKDKQYLTGDQFTIADICFAPYIDYAMNDATAKAIFSKYPHFTAWWNRVSERPSWRKAAGRA